MFACTNCATTHVCTSSKLSRHLHVASSIQLGCGCDLFYSCDRCLLLWFYGKCLKSLSDLSIISLLLLSTKILMQYKPGRQHEDEGHIDTIITSVIETCHSLNMCNCKYSKVCLELKSVISEKTESLDIYSWAQMCCHVRNKNAISSHSFSSKSCCHLLWLNSLVTNASVPFRSINLPTRVSLNSHCTLNFKYRRVDWCWHYFSHEQWMLIGILNVSNQISWIKFKNGCRRWHEPSERKQQQSSCGRETTTKVNEQNSWSSLSKKFICHNSRVLIKWSQ